MEVLTTEAHVLEPPVEDLLRYEAVGDFELRDDESGRPTLVGHFAVFDSWTEINSSWEGQFLERIAPGAFAKTISENASRMKVLFNHGKDFLGEQALGRIQSLEEDERGAKYEVGLYEGIPPLLMNGLRDGAYGASFRFNVVKQDFDTRPERSDHNPDGMPERTILEARVSEFGPVTFPAYGEATAGLRSATDWLVEQNLRRQLEAFAERAAALGELKVTEASTNFVIATPADSEALASSRSTRDYLQPGKERRSWELP